MDGGEALRVHGHENGRGRQGKVARSALTVCLEAGPGIGGISGDI